MRFFSDGPNIPDNLLSARDEERVVFFCGAGVSMARAALPDFLGLTEQVIDKLGVEEDHDSKKLVCEIKELGKRIKTPGLMPVDRIFGLLEREFLSCDIEEAVAQALKPSADPDLSAHKILLDLATTPSGKVRLITTNFDRLFDICKPDLGNFHPPRLPDNYFNGIVYLHGRAKLDYSGAEEEGFVLSSSQFGRAYLSDAWATSFIRNLIENYTIVFVGYTADDLPVQYLLEALQKETSKSKNIFAFQAGEDGEAAGLWRHKGVTAIPYNADNNHSALWDTLAAWAERARDPEAWFSKIIEVSRKGPSALKPHERGQVAHLVSTYEGAKKFCTNENPPPAEWLCVFDAHQRYKQPGYSNKLSCEDYIDPFDLYGLDSDILPEGIDPKDISFASPIREIPKTAWDAFKLNNSDRKLVENENLAVLWDGMDIPKLVPRLRVLGMWIVKVCAQPLTVWWAAHQSPLHRDIQQQILLELQRNDKIPLRISQDWYRLFQVWDDSKVSFFSISGERKPSLGLFTLQDMIKQHGWNYNIVQQLGAILQPRLVVEPDRWGNIRSTTTENSESLLGFKPSYPDSYCFEHCKEITVPAEWRATFVKVLRQNLELADMLVREFHEYDFHSICPIAKDGTRDDYNRMHDDYERTRGLSGLVIQFSEQFSQLVMINEEAARQEFLSWPVGDDRIFARLRIWAAGKPEVVLDTDFTHVIASLNDTAFWNPVHRRDLLLVLASRWQKLSVEARNFVEQRLLQGRLKPWPGDNEESFKKEKTHSSLECLHWLIKQGCEISQTTTEALEKLRNTAPDWRIEYADAAADEPIKTFGGWVKTNADYGPLSGIPLSAVLEKAKELSGRSDHFLIENRPFTGLAEKCPVRAFSALSYQARQGHFPKWAWQKFFNSGLWENTKSSERKSIKPRFVILIAERLVSYPDEQLVTIMRPVFSWLYKASDYMDMNHIATFDRIIQKLIGILHKYTDASKTSVVHKSNQTDWMMEALNSPVGDITRVMFKDPRIKNLPAGQGFPHIWLDRIETLLALSGDLRRYVLVMLFHHLSWFYEKDSKWTATHLLPVFEEDNLSDQEVAWTGFLRSQVRPSRAIYKLLKDKMLTFAKTRHLSRRYLNENIAAMILAGWINTDEKTGARWISDQEMRNTLLNAGEEFRTQVLWHIRRWMNEEAGREKWTIELPQFLKIWPKQLLARSPGITTRFCELAIFSGGQFPAIVQLILPFLTEAQNGDLLLYALNKKSNNIIERYPKETLKLLNAILPNNASSWPYGVETSLQKIIEADNNLHMDEDLRNLQRKWNAR